MSITIVIEFTKGQLDFCRFQIFFSVIHSPRVIVIVKTFTNNLNILFYSFNILTISEQVKTTKLFVFDDDCLAVIHDIINNTVFAVVD